MRTVAILSLLATTAVAAAFANAQPASAPAKTKAVSSRFLEANYHHGRQAWDKALPLYESIVSDPSASLADKRRAIGMIIDIHRRNKRTIPQAIEAAARMAEVLAADPQAVHDAYVLQADLLWEANQKPEAIAKLRKYVELNSAQKRQCADVQIKMANWLTIVQNWKEAYAEAAKAVEFDASDDKLVARAYGYMGDAALQSADLDKCVTAYVRTLEPKYAAVRSSQEFLQAANRVADCLVKLKRTDDLLAHCNAMAKQAPEMTARQDYGLRAADLLYGQLNRPDEALKAYEQFFVDSSGICDRWFEAQARIVEILRKLNRPEEALQAARICFDACSDAGGVNQWTQTIMDLMRQIDGNPTRANQFLEYQQLGPAGKDQRAGTDDDLVNPLASVPYPSCEQRVEAFAKARLAAGDSAAASRLRAMTFIYTGKPSEAMKHFADALSRCSAGDFRMMSNDLVAVGVRAVQGHPIGLDPYYTFLAYGPDGSDGKGGTSDDLTDVFAAIGVRAPAGGSGGLAQVPPEELAQLKEILPLLEYCSGHWQPPGLQRDSIAALTRVHVAMCDWGAPSQREWYIRQMLLSDNSMQGPLSDAALASAKAGQLHFGSARRFYEQLSQSAESANMSLQPDATRARDVFNAFVGTLDKPHDLKPKAKPFTVPAAGKK